MRVVGRDEVVQHLRAAAGLPALLAEDVLVRDRCPGQEPGAARGAARIGGGCLEQGLVAVNGDEGIELRVERVDALQVFGGQLDGRNLLVGQLLRQLF
ncbi:hypothetical protein D3C72_1592910 [compost metagenome]